MKKYLFSVLLTVFMLFTAFHIPIENTAEAVESRMTLTIVAHGMFSTYV